VPLIGLAGVAFVAILAVWRVQSEEQLRAVIWLFLVYAGLEAGVSISGLAHWLTSVWNLVA